MGSFQLNPIGNRQFIRSFLKTGNLKMLIKFSHISVVLMLILGAIAEPLDYFNPSSSGRSRRGHENSSGNYICFSKKGCDGKSQAYDSPGNCKKKGFNSVLYNNSNGCVHKGKY